MSNGKDMMPWTLSVSRRRGFPSPLPPIGTSICSSSSSSDSDSGIAESRWDLSQVAPDLERPFTRAKRRSGLSLPYSEEQQQPSSPIRKVTNTEPITLAHLVATSMPEPRDQPVRYPPSSSCWNIDNLQQSIPRLTRQPILPPAFGPHPQPTPAYHPPEFRSRQASIWAASCQDTRTLSSYTPRWQPPKESANRFRPMEALAQPYRAFTYPLSGLNNRSSAAFSSRYCGRHSEANASADHLAPTENCALWLTNLPPDVTYNELLGRIRNVGRVFCTFINQPDNICHRTAAAKVVFFDPVGAQKLLRTAFAGQLTIRDHRTKVAYNRIKYAKRQIMCKESRVLIITGRPHFVNETSLTQFFQQRFIFQIDQIRVLAATDERTVLEYSFGSYRCQANMGIMALEKDLPLGFEKVEYGKDPCECDDKWCSLIVAAQRVQGIHTTPGVP